MTVPGTGTKDDVLGYQVGSTQLRDQLRCIEDLHAMLVEVGDSATADASRWTSGPCS